MSVATYIVYLLALPYNLRKRRLCLLASINISYTMLLSSQILWKSYIIWVPECLYENIIMRLISLAIFL